MARKELTPGRVDITLKQKPDYRVPDRQAGIAGFVIDWDGEQLTFWADDVKNYFWRIAAKKYDYYRVYEEFNAVAHGRTKMSRLLKPIFKYAEANEQPVYVCGVRCSRLEAVPIVESVSTEEAVSALPAG